MPNFFKRIFSKPSDPPETAMAEVPDQLPEPDPRLNALLLKLFESHGVQAKQAGKWVAADGGRLMARAAILGHRKNGQFDTVGMQVLVLLPPGDIIEEMYVGFGESMQEAVNEACRYFVESSFHVFIKAFVDVKCDHVEVEEHVMGGVRRRVTLGVSCMRGAVPEGEARTAGFIGFMELLKNSNLPKGTHWIRIYHAEGIENGVEPTTEVLLDNKPWIEMQTAAADLNWPDVKEFYSIRNFMVIQDAG